MYTLNSCVKAGSSRIALWNGIAVAKPPTTNSDNARRALSIACCRVAPVTINFASKESKLPPMVSPPWNPASTRTPGPVGIAQSVIRPGAGRNDRPGSSPFILNSIECPRISGSSKPSDSPSAILNCSRTRSSPVTSSLTGCSTCKRVFTSRNEIVPSTPIKNSHVPAPT